MVDAAFEALAMAEGISELDDYNEDEDDDNMVVH